MKQATLGKGNKALAWHGLGWALLLAWLTGCGDDRSAYEPTQEAFQPAAFASFGSDANLTLSAGLATLAADGAATSGIAATFLTLSGSPLAGQRLTFSSTDPNLAFSPVNAVTDCNGRASSNVSSLAPGAKTIYAGVGLARLQRVQVTYTCPGHFLAGVTDGLPMTSPTRLALSDFDGDGKQDVVAAASTANGVNVSLGYGNGRYALPTLYALPAFSQSVAARLDHPLSQMA